ncbi:MAG: hypothetical protein ACRYGB_04450 [Janthinobacterium lividum]
MIELSTLKTAFETVGKIKKAFESLKSSNLFLKEVDIYDLIEKHFSFEPLPKGKIKLKGRLSNYTLNSSFPIYTPGHFKGMKQDKQKLFDIKHNRFLDQFELTLQTTLLNIPSITYRPIELPDKSSAKILWLYREDLEGLVYEPTKSRELNQTGLCDIFGIENKDKPIPILVDLDFPNHFLYKTLEIIGTVFTASIQLFENFSNQTDSFVLDYYSNFFRPFSSQDGILAIDARRPSGNFRQLEDKKNPFKIIYTVQGLIEMPEKFNDTREANQIMNECIDAIPDRQGLGEINSIGTKQDDISISIVSIGNTYWQRHPTEFTIAAFKEINLTDVSYNQASLTELTNNWQVWQKTARKRIRDNFGVEPKIKPIICSNPNHDKLFHPNGLQISKTVEDKLLSEFPEVRKSIDWLGISVGKT